MPGPSEWLIIAIVAVVVIFGAKKIPEMARSMGRAQSEFKKGMKEGAADLDEPAAQPPAPAQPQAPAPAQAQAPAQGPAQPQAQAPAPEQAPPPAAPQSQPGPEAKENGSSQ